MVKLSAKSRGYKGSYSSLGLPRKESSGYRYFLRNLQIISSRHFHHHDHWNCLGSLDLCYSSLGEQVMEGRKISDTRKGSGRTLLLKFSYFLRTKKQEQPRKSFYTQEQDTTYTMSKTENVMENLPSNQKIEKGMENVRKEIHAVRSAPGIDATGHQILSDTEQVYSNNFRSHGRR